MKLISKTIQLGQAVKNVQRFRQILQIFAKYGFADIIDRGNLGNYLPARWSVVKDAKSENTTPVRVKQAFEELGPTFVKFGQLLSTRSDLLPEAYIEEFTKLQDNVQPVSFETVKRIIESELKKKLADAFEKFSETPLASASIGQAHEAVLKTGEKVVVKIQRPEIDRVIRNDISLMAFLSKWLEKNIPEVRVANLPVLVDEFFRALAYELDYKVEANNMEKVRTNLKEFPEIRIPKVYKELSTHKILVQEQFEGIRLNDFRSIESSGVDKKKIVQIGARAFFKTVMTDGFFHGDLHGGNLFILPENKLGMIDFGLVGRLSQKARDQLASMVFALVSEDYEMLCYQYAELGSSDASIDFDAFQREVRNTLSPYLGLSLSEMNTGRVLIEATKIASKYDIRVPGDWMIVFRAIVTLEGMGRALDPEFDLMATGQDLIKDLIKNQYSKERLTKEMLWLAKESVGLFQIMPRHFRWFFKRWSSNNYAIEIKSPDIANLGEQISKAGRRVAFGIIAAALFIASSSSLQGVRPDLQWLGLPLSVLIYVFFGLICAVLTLF